VVLALSITQTFVDLSRIIKIFSFHYGDRTNASLTRAMVCFTCSAVLYFNKPRIEDAVSPFIVPSFPSSPSDALNGHLGRAAAGAISALPDIARLAPFQVSHRRCQAPSPARTRHHPRLPRPLRPLLTLDYALGQHPRLPRPVSRRALLVR
jgi:hypothetical protein